MTSNIRNKLLLIPFVTWFGFFIVAPLFYIFMTSLSQRGPLGEILDAKTLESYALLLDPLYAKVFFNTLIFALITTLSTLIIAFPLAFYVSRLRGRSKTWVLALILVPFWTSFLVRLLAFTDVLRLKPFGIDWLYTDSGVILAMVYNYLPFAILPIYSSLDKIDNSLLEAGEDLGATKYQNFCGIILPLSKKGLFVASLFVFIPAMGEFLIPDIVGGSKNFLLGSFLQNQFLTSRNWPLGSAAIVCLIALSLILIYIASLFKSHDLISEHAQ